MGDITFDDLPNAQPQGDPSAPQQPPSYSLTQPGGLPAGAKPGPAVGQSKSLLDAALPELDESGQRALRMIVGGGAMGNPGLEGAGKTLYSLNPAARARDAQLKAQADFAAKRQNQRYLGENVLGSFAKLVHSAMEMPDEDLASAIGPRNMAVLNDQSPTYLPLSRTFGSGIPIPGLSGPTTVDPQSGQPIKGDLTPVQREAILHPNDPRAQRAQKAQTLLKHDATGIGVAMGGEGAANTDSARDQVNDAIARAFQAPDRASMMEVLEHAKGLIMNKYNLTPQETDRIMNANIQQFRHEDMLGRAMEVPREAYDMLIANQKDPTYVASFNKHFNKGRDGMAEAFIAERTRRDAQHPPAPEQLPQNRLQQPGGQRMLNLPPQARAAPPQPQPQQQLTPPPIGYAPYP